MPDIETIWSPAALRGDWAVTGGQLAAGAANDLGDLSTSVIISLFTDRQARPDDIIPDGTTDRRGWPEDEDVPIGSRLWLLDRAKQTDETLRRAHDYIVEALQWLIDDGVAAAIDVRTEWSRPGFLGALVTVRRRDGSTTALDFAWAWGA